MANATNERTSGRGSDPTFSTENEADIVAMGFGGSSRVEVAARNKTRTREGRGQKGKIENKMEKPHNGPSATMVGKKMENEETSAR